MMSRWKRNVHDKATRSAAPLTVSKVGSKVGGFVMDDMLPSMSLWHADIQAKRYGVLESYGVLVKTSG